MAEPATENKTSSDKLDWSLLPNSVSKLQLSSSSPSGKMAQPATQERNGWSHLPEELLHIISDKLEDCFDTIHARSVCRHFWNGDAFVIDPYSLEETPLIASERMRSTNYLIPCGDDELFRVERINPLHGVVDFSKLVCRVSRLDEEAGEWVMVTDLGDRVLLIGQPGNSFCLGKDLPDGCGVNGNSLLFISEPFGVTDPYKYEVDLGFWRFSGDTCVTILRTSPMGTHLQVDHEKP